MKLYFSLFGVESLGFYVGVNGLLFAWRNWLRKYSGYLEFGATMFDVDYLDGA